MSLIPGLGAVPELWSVRRGRFALQYQQRPVLGRDGIVTAFRDGEVTLRSNRRTEGFTNAIQEIGYQGVEPGDLVVHSMDGFAGAIGVSAARGKMSPVVHVYRCADGDSRFMAYVLRSLAASNYVQALAKGIRERSTSFDRSTLADLDLPFPTAEEQRRIADFLDDQVSRIDQAIALRMEQRNRLDERRRSAVDLKLINASDGVIPLRRLVSDVCVGIVIQPAALYVSDDMPGVAALRGTDIREGWIDTSAPVRLSAQGHRDNPRSQLRLGDVVVVRTGVAGTAAVVTAETMGWNCIDLVIVRTGPRLIPEFLELVMNHFVSQAKIGAAASGSIQVHFGVGALRDLEIPNATPSEQRRLVQTLAQARADTSKARAAMESQIRLLTERKRALITAAVTGEFDVTTASGRGVA